MPLSTNSIVFDAKRSRVWASLKTPTGGATDIVALDPTSGNVKSTIAVGSGPSALALSDDGSTLYVGLDGARAFRRVDLTTNKPGDSTTISVYGRLDAPTALGIKIQPGSTSTVAVLIAQELGSQVYGPVIFDDGVARPNSDPDGFASQFVWDGKDRIVGVNATTTSAYVSDFVVDANGLTLTSRQDKGIVYSPTFQLVGDRFYTTDGIVLDRTTLESVGHFAVSFDNLSYGPAIDVANKRAYFLELQGTTASVLHVYDLVSFAETSRTTLPGIVSTDIAGQQGRSNLLLCGSRRLALRTADSVFFIDNIPQG